MLTLGCLCYRLVEMGFEKMVNELDVKEAARLGMHTTPADHRCRAAAPGGPGHRPRVRHPLPHARPVR